MGELLLQRQVDVLLLRSEMDRSLLLIVVAVVAVSLSVSVVVGKDVFLVLLLV